MKMTSLEFMKKKFKQAVKNYQSANEKPNTPDTDLVNLRNKIDFYETAINALELYDAIEVDSNHSVCRNCVHCKAYEYEKGFAVYECFYEECAPHFLTRLGCSRFYSFEEDL